MEKKFLFLFYFIFISIIWVSDNYVKGSTSPELKYSVGQEFGYSVDGSLISNGAKNRKDSFTKGNQARLQSTLVCKCIDSNETSFLFVMNMFQTSVSVSESDDPPPGSNDFGDSLGYDMYFLQLKTGEIPVAWYQDGDSPYFINVKLGAINAFQTRLFPSSDEPHMVMESDPVGLHMSQIISKNEGGLLLTKAFNQDDFKQFHDPSVSKENFQVEGRTDTLVNDLGFIQSSRVHQSVLLKYSAGSGTPSFSGTMKSDTTGFDIFLATQGVLNVSMLSSASLYSFSGLHPNLQSIAAPKYNLVGGSLLSLASQASIPSFSPQPTAVLLSDLHQSLLEKPSKSSYSKTMKQIISLDPRLSEILFQSLLSDEQFLNSLDRFGRARLFSLLALSGQEASLISIITGTSLFYSNPNTRIQAVMVTPSLPNPSESLIAELAKISNLCNDDSYPCSDPSSTLSTVSHLALQAILVDGDESSLDQSFHFPFNKTFDKSVKLGGDVLNAVFDANFFAGTNFNCNSEYFAYEGRAEASATLGLFGLTKKVVEALAIYGRAPDGSPLADEMSLSVWGKTIYQKKFPQIDCSPHTYDIAHTSPGISVSYTIWVSIIPITFSAGATLELDLKWGWEICDKNLQAQIELIPSAGISVSGSAEINLLLLRAGIALSAGFDTALIPSAYVEGSECLVGFNLTLSNQPFEADLEAFFEWKSCKFLFFDCHWGKHHDRDLWHYTYPGHDDTLFSKTWKIPKPLDV